VELRRRAASSKQFSLSQGPGIINRTIFSERPSIRTRRKLASLDVLSPKITYRIIPISFYPRCFLHGCPTNTDTVQGSS
jgi:hypothetical protein